MKISISCEGKKRPFSFGFQIHIFSDSKVHPDGL